METTMETIIATLRTINNDFAISLVAQYDRKGYLSDKQMYWAKKIAGENNNKETIDLTPIKNMFENARHAGFKRAKYRAEGITLSLAGNNSRNVGAIYVKDFDGNYLGKVQDNMFHPVYMGEKAIEPLKIIAQNPLNAAIKYGQQTGQCACCGRELTNSESIKLGIGPICKEKFGL
jgi:hypothetical protein